MEAKDKTVGHFWTPLANPDVRCAVTDRVVFRGLAMPDKLSSCHEKGREDGQRLKPRLWQEVNEIHLTTNWLSDEVVISWPDNTRDCLSKGYLTQHFLPPEIVATSQCILLHPEVGQQVAAEIESKGGRAAFFKVDVSDETEVQLGVKSVLDSFGKIDILVNNAGITGTNRLTHETTVEDWDKIFAVNVRGTFLCTKHTLNSMMSLRRGSIVNLSSIYGLIGNADVPPYHATKGALLTMIKTDAICYAQYGIRVNAVHPGTTLTPLVRKVGAQYPGGLEAYIKMMKEKHPLCLGEPVDVANAILFLASDEARFITGASLVVDGGYTAQ